MKHPHLQIALRVALSIMGVRLVLFYGGFQTTWTDPAYIFLNLAAIPALAIYAIWPRAVRTGFLDDAKNTMKMLGLYALLMTAFFWVYYAFLDTEFFKSKQEELIFAALQSGETGDDINEITDRIRGFFSLRNGTAIVLAGYMVLSVFYAILFSAIKRVVPGFSK